MERHYLNRWKQYLTEQTTTEEKAASMLAWVNGYIKKYNFKLVASGGGMLEYKHSNLKGVVVIQLSGGTTDRPSLEITVPRAGLRVNDRNDEYLYNEMILTSQWMDDRGPALEKVLASFGVK
jgi:hypothetical protein